VALTVALCILLAGCASKPTPQPSTAVQAEITASRSGKGSVPLKNPQPGPPVLDLPARLLPRQDFATRKLPGALPAGWRREFPFASGVVQFMSTGLNANQPDSRVNHCGDTHVARTRDLRRRHEEGFTMEKDEPNFASSGGRGKVFRLPFGMSSFRTSKPKYRTVPFEFWSATR